MHRALFAVPLLAATTCLGQTIIGLNCPVKMKAEKQATNRTVWIVALEDSGQPKSQPQPQSASHPNNGVQVELSAPSDKALRQVELSVDFVPLGMRILPLNAQTGAPANTQKKTFNLSANDQATRKLTGSLLVGPAATITRVNLLSITYADGTQWHPTRGQSCTVEPSHFLLVDNH